VRARMSAQRTRCFGSHSTPPLLSMTCGACTAPFHSTLASSFLIYCPPPAFAARSSSPLHSPRHLLSASPAAHAASAPPLGRAVERSVGRSEGRFVGRPPEHGRVGRPPEHGRTHPPFNVISFGNNGANILGFVSEHRWLHYHSERKPRWATGPSFLYGPSLVVVQCFKRNSR
jgi:hypothetical protein